MEIVKSRLLAAFPHGFTTRDGGASAPPYDALNLGGGVGDDPAAVAGNWARLGRETGLRFARVDQVHGARVVVEPDPDAPREPADAVVSRRRGLAACVSVADCVPVLLADPETGAVAAAHAGWRGTLARIAAETAATLSRLTGTPVGSLRAAVGPSIGRCCYEVSPDLADRFTGAFGAGVVAQAETPHLDLWQANVQALVALGLRPENVEVLGLCTACDRRRFFSHRRDAGRTGRQAGFIAPLP
ncbi:peptidoglycan editing factor PgeF [Anaeromyxobacter paludicola]|uniref:Purine nucleoside phosphorylase n=1 Tax=Anaeromyxobacter paludicola TaxID=2918171 RepID=A0ABN6N8A1_9BACT|nr:peptidoglycan editing factor PgeF [Anaeromyxobacter paludicola]BDG08264.1 laccase domain protein [Anaeromyxobacter paludicola]